LSFDRYCGVQTELVDCFNQRLLGFAEIRSQRNQRAVIATSGVLHATTPLGGLSVLATYQRVESKEQKHEGVSIRNVRLPAVGPSDAAPQKIRKRDLCATRSISPRFVDDNVQYILGGHRGSTCCTKLPKQLHPLAIPSFVAFLFCRIACEDIRLANRIITLESTQVPTRKAAGSSSVPDATLLSN